jgi:hypothetical protein
MSALGQKRTFKSSTLGDRKPHAALTCVRAAGVRHQKHRQHRHKSTGRAPGSGDLKRRSHAASSRYSLITTALGVRPVPLNAGQSQPAASDTAVGHTGARAARRNGLDAYAMERRPQSNFAPRARMPVDSDDPALTGGGSIGYNELLQQEGNRPSLHEESRANSVRPLSRFLQYAGPNVSVGCRNVRFGSLADIAACPSDVCFTPESGH